MDKKRLAFVRVFGAPPIARSVEEMLIRTFPEYQVETITLTNILKRRPDILALNALATIREYGRQILGRERAFRRAFLVTPFLFRRVKHLVHRHLAGRQDEFTFSFQLQSLFDASTPFFPHYVYTDHTNLTNLTYSEFERAHVHSDAWLALEREVYHNAHHIFTRSSNITQSLVQQYALPEHKVTTAYVGVNAPAAPAPRDPGAYGKQHILFVGTDWERKGGPELVQAFAALRQRLPDARLTIVGCTPKIDVANCDVVGPVPVERLTDYYQAASVFCLPTKREPFGVVFVEAMAHKLPLIGTELGAIPDFVVPGETGYLVPPNDVPALTQALLNLLADPDGCRRMGEHGYRLARERYNWHHVGNTIRQVIVSSPTSPLTPVKLATA